MLITRTPGAGHGPVCPLAAAVLGARVPRARPSWCNRRPWGRVRLRAGPGARRAGSRPWSRTARARPATWSRDQVTRSWRTWRGGPRGRRGAGRPGRAAAGPPGTPSGAPALRPGPAGRPPGGSTGTPGKGLLRLGGRATRGRRHVRREGAGRPQHRDGLAVARGQRSRRRTRRRSPRRRRCPARAGRWSWSRGTTAAGPRPPLALRRVERARGAWKVGATCGSCGRARTSAVRQHRRSAQTAAGATAGPGQAPPSRSAEPDGAGVDRGAAQQVGARRWSSPPRYFAWRYSWSAVTYT